MVVNKAIVVIMNRYIFMREYFTSKSYFTDKAANTTNATIIVTIADSWITLLSISNGSIIVVAAIGIDVDRPTIIDNEFNMTLDLLLKVARLYIPAVIIMVVCPSV